MYRSFFSPTVWMQSPEVSIMLCLNLCECVVVSCVKYISGVFWFIFVVPYIHDVFVVYVSAYAPTLSSLSQVSAFQLRASACLLSFVRNDDVVFCLVYCLLCVRFSGRCFRKCWWLRVCLYKLYEVSSFCFPFQFTWTWSFLYILYIVDFEFVVVGLLWPPKPPVTNWTIKEAQAAGIEF